MEENKNVNETNNEEVVNKPTEEEIIEAQKRYAEIQYNQKLSKSGGNKQVITEAKRKRKRELQKLAKREQRNKK